MPYEVTAEQEQLGATLREMLESRGQPRLTLDSGPCIDTDVWKHLIDLGLVGIFTPEALGGSGGSIMDQTIVAEQVGFAGAAVPVVPSSLAAHVLTTLATDEAAELAG